VPRTSCASWRRRTPPPSPARSARSCAARGCTAATSSTGGRLYRAGALSALARPKGRPRTKDPLADEVERLRRRNARLEARLATAERIIEIQGKVSELLGIPLAQASEDVESGS
jgi:hypothetical protein